MITIKTISIPQESRSGRIYANGSVNTITSSSSFSGSGGGTTSNLIGLTTSGATYLGYNAGISFTGNTNYNTFIGSSAGAGNRNGYSNTYLGYQAGSSINGNRNIVIGYQAGSCFTNVSDSLVINNSDSETPLLYGQFYNAGFTDPQLKINGQLFINGLTCGAVGDVLYYNSANGEITRGAGGAGSGLCGVTNTANTLLGVGAGQFNCCAWNTLIGVNSGYLNTTGQYNVNLGGNAGYTNTVGNCNTKLGYEAGYDGCGGGNVMLGYRAGYCETGSAKLYISNSSTSSPLLYGCFSTPMVKINGAFCTSSNIVESGTTLCNKYLGKTAKACSASLADYAGLAQCSQALYENENGFSAYSLLDNGYFCIMGSDSSTSVYHSDVADTASNAGYADNASCLNGHLASYYQTASNAITTSNIGSQNVNYADTAGNSSKLGGNWASYYLNNNDSTSIDLNCLTQSGVYRMNANNCNQPSGTQWGQLFTMHGGADTITQIATGYASDNIYWRSGNPTNVGGSGTWQPWKSIIDSDGGSITGCLSICGGLNATAGYTSNNSCGGTGCAAYFPVGLYAAGSNNWIYGTTNFNEILRDNNQNKWQINSVDGNANFTHLKLCCIAQQEKNYALYYDVTTKDVTYSTIPQFVGSGSTKYLTTNDNNTIVGFAAGACIQGSSQNTIVGVGAAYSILNSNDNTVLGNYSAYSMLNAGANTFVGKFSAYNLTCGSSNVIIGQCAGYSQTLGCFNTLIGNNAGANITTASSNVMIGYCSGFLETGSNKLYISNSCTASPLICGCFSTPSVKVNGSASVTGALTSGNAKSLGTCGYTRTTEGLLIQWGTWLSNTDAVMTIYFPTAFASTAYVVVSDDYTNGTTTQKYAGCFTIQRTSAIDSNETRNYIALGI